MQLFAKTQGLVAGVLLLTQTILSAADQTPKQILDTMQRVADWQLANPSKHKPTDWTQGAGYAGIMALAGISGDAKYREAMRLMGETNEWKLGPRKFHADDHCVGQAYVELYRLYREPKMLTAMSASFDSVLAQPSTVESLEFTQPKGRAGELWSWCDSLFMAPPAWVELYSVTGNEKYLTFGLTNWWRTTEYLYDKEEHLYFRDSTYFKKAEANGKKVFWGRGNGWVMGGLVRVLESLPTNHPDRPRFEQLFKDMSAKILSCQQPDGLWRASLLDPDSYPLKETSGSGFYTYALAWGVNQGLLDRATYEPAVKKAWAALVECVDANGKLTHVQPIGADPKKFAPESTEIYGVGAFLLAGSELYRLTVTESKKPVAIQISNPGNFSRQNETVELNLSGKVAVMDGLTSRLLDSQGYTPSVGGDKVLFQVDLAPGETRQYLVLDASTLAAQPTPVLTTFARFVPERMDDFAWENDRIAFRMYGPALQKHDGDKTGSGVDVWCKHVRQPVINSMYARSQTYPKNDPRNSYHNDDGNAADNFRAGPNRGCGGAALWADDKLCPSRCYKSWKLITVGPIRSEFELTYETWNVQGQPVSEVKRVSLDRGSNLTRYECRYDTGGREVTAAAGLWIHSAESILAHEGNWFSLWEKFSEGDGPGFIPVGLVWPPATGGQFKQADEHALMIAGVKPGVPLVYYAGAGWTKGLDFSNAESWNAYLSGFAARLAAPLKVLVN